jgi:hypothetical protein
MTIAVNLYGLKLSGAAQAAGVRYESAVHESADISIAEPGAREDDGEEAKVPRDLTVITLIAGMLLLLLELMYVKFRGDL